jgi:hypothetical protein
MDTDDMTARRSSSDNPSNAAVILLHATKSTGKREAGAASLACRNAFVRRSVLRFAM